MGTTLSPSVGGRPLSPLFAGTGRNGAIRVLAVGEAAQVEKLTPLLRQASRVEFLGAETQPYVFRSRVFSEKPDVVVVGATDNSLDTVAQKAFNLLEGTYAHMAQSQTLPGEYRPGVVVHYDPELPTPLYGVLKAVKAKVFPEPKNRQENGQGRTLSRGPLGERFQETLQRLLRPWVHLMNPPGIPKGWVDQSLTLFASRRQGEAMSLPPGRIPYWVVSPMTTRGQAPWHWSDTFERALTQADSSK